MHITVGERRPIGTPSRSAPAGPPSKGSAPLRFGGLLIFALALLFRLPVLLHPEISSDSAIVGLQGVHMLRGEWSWFLWSTSYQSSLDPLIAGLFAKLFGARPLAIVLGPVLEQCALGAVLYRLLRRHLGDWPALAACLPLLLPLEPEACLLSFAATRSLAGLVAFSGALLIDAGAAAVGAAVLVLSTGLDLYTVELLPALFLLSRPLPWKSLLAGALPAALAVYALHFGEHTAVLAADPGRFARNLRLLMVCLPDAIGTLWRHTQALWLLRALGFVSLASAAIFGALLPVPRQVRWLGLCGLLGIACSLGAFLLSSQPQDIESSRYLVAIQWMAPLALAPAAAFLGARRLTLGLAPWLACAAVASALAIGVPRTLRPLPADGLDADDRALRDVLRARGIEAGLAQYWVAYKLTYLFDEKPVLAPMDRGESRYPPYEARVAAARRTAYIFDPLETRARPEELLSALGRSNKAFQVVNAGRYLVVQVDR